MKTFLIDYDLHLIHKDLIARGHKVDIDSVVPISSNAPDDFRIYFSSVHGDIHLGVINPPAPALIFACAFNDDSGSVYAYVLRRKSIVGVFRLKAESVLFCSALLAEQNLRRDALVQSCRELTSPENLRGLLPAGSLSDRFSDEDIVNILYRDTM